MDLMNMKERKKSYKFPIFLLVLFFVFGIGLIIYATSNEQTPIVVGENIDVNIYDNNYLKDVETTESNDNIVGDFVIAIENDSVCNKEDCLKANITIPVISVNYEKLDDLNNEINETFNTSYLKFKGSMKDVENDFTYKVTYKYYENSFEDMDILSVTLYERIIDNSNGNEIMEKIHAYNIDLSTLEVLDQDAITLKILGKEYKSIIKDAINEYVINNNMDDEDYHYSYTNLEKFYIKENTFRLLFNPGELVDEKYSIINIKIEEDK